MKLEELDLDHVIADLEAIRAINPQRFEMEQLTAVIYADGENGIFAGYKDVTEDEFWVRGHMPDYPLMPGVIQCEAAAQLCSWFCVTEQIMGGDFIGFGGLENVRFRIPIEPGCRLVLIGKVTKRHRRQTTCNVQGFVEGTLVIQADIIGTPLKSNQTKKE